MQSPSAQPGLVTTFEFQSELEPRPEQPFVLPNEPQPWAHDERVIQSLLSQQGAMAITQWRKAEDGQFIVTEGETPVNSEFRDKAGVAVAQAMESGRTQLRIIASADGAQQLVAAVLPGTIGQAISVVFPHGPMRDSQQILRQRCSDVELVAARLAILHLTSDRLAPHPDPSNEGAVNEKTNLSTWADIRAAAGDRLRSSIQVLVRRRVTYLAIATSLIGIGILPFPFVISCKVQCEPEVRRFVAAPFDAKLLVSEVDVGQHVEQGQVLAELDGSEIRSQLAGLRAKIAQAAQRRSAALAHRDASNSELERLEVQHLQREIDVLEHRQQNLQIRSPIAGVIVTGDLRRSQGATVAVGENLFEIAPLDILIAEIAIPETEISYIAAGMSTTIALDAISGNWHHTQIDRIHPRNELRDNSSVFIAEASIENAESHIRPGMNGTARIRIGSKPIAWILFHKPYQALRQLIGL